MAQPGVQRLVPVTLDGPAGRLEGLLQTVTETPEIAAVVCHPHPAHGGTMHNKVVHRAASTLLGLGAAVLRFNFRGVGKSEGQYDLGAGELEDARAAFLWLGARFPKSRRWVAGFSFGSWIAARLAVSEPPVELLVLIAPPVRTSSFDMLRTATVPKRVVQGTQDEVCPREALEREFLYWAEPKSVTWVEGASHFFDKRLSAFSEALLEALGARGKGATS